MTLVKVLQLLRGLPRMPGTRNTWMVIATIYVDKISFSLAQKNKRKRKRKCSELISDFCEVSLNSGGAREEFWGNVGVYHL